MTRVDMPITKQYFITKHFQVFPHFKTKLSIFLSLEVQNEKLQMFFEPQKQRNKTKNVRRKRVMFCFNFSP